MLPFLAVPLALAWRRWPLTTGALAVVSAGIMLAATATDPLLPDDADPGRWWRLLVHGDFTRTIALGIAPFALLVAAAVVLVFRFLDGDEGVYTYASRLVLHGHVPYRDFFYEQMPLLPYVYGAWIGIFGESWYAARSLSALAAAATGALLFLHVERRLGGRPALAGIGLYALSGLVFGYFTIVKTFALASLFLFAAFVLVEARRPRWLVAGLLVGLAVDTRLVFAAAVPAFAVLAARRRALPSFGGRLAAGPRARVGLPPP